MEADVETGSSLEATLADVFLPVFFRLGHHRAVSGILPLAVRLQIIQLLFHRTLLGWIGFPLELGLEILLALRFWGLPGAHVRGGLVAHRAVTTPTQLKLDVLRFEFDLGY